MLAYDKGALTDSSDSMTALTHSGTSRKRASKKESESLKS